MSRNQLFVASQEDNSHEFVVTGPCSLRDGYLTLEAAQNAADKLNAEMDKIEENALRTADPSLW